VLVQHHEVRKLFHLLQLCLYNLLLGKSNASVNYYFFRRRPSGEEGQFRYAT
jgi:hypothetical protein